jgi:hypothetical protein
VPSRVALPVLLAALVLAGCGEKHVASDPHVAVLPAGAVRPADAKTDQDTNSANLASAVITYSFGQLPRYIDDARFRLLPHDVQQTSAPGETTTRVYRITVPRTGLVLDTVYTASPTTAETRQLAGAWTVDVALDGRHVANPASHWVFYRNNGPQICRIYFPGDLGSLNMGANSMVFRPLVAGRHRLVVRLEQRLPPARPARLVAVYRLLVLDRGPNARERAIAPEEDEAPPASNRTPLSFRPGSGF